MFRVPNEPVVDMNEPYGQQTCCISSSPWTWEPRNKEQRNGNGKGEVVTAESCSELFLALRKLRASLGNRGEVDRDERRRGVATHADVLAGALALAQDQPTELFPLGDNHIGVELELPELAL